MGGAVGSPWQLKNGKESPSTSAGANANANAASSSSSSAERLKNTSLTCLGLGSSHLSSFGGSWLKRGGPGGLRAPAPSWVAFTGGRWTGAAGGASREEETHLYSSSPPPTHTNLFTSAATATGGRDARTGAANGKPGSGGVSQRREGPSWTDRRGAGEPRLSFPSRVCFSVEGCADRKSVV